MAFSLYKLVHGRGVCLGRTSCSFCVGEFYFWCTWFWSLERVKLQVLVPDQLYMKYCKEDGQYSYLICSLKYFKKRLKNLIHLFTVLKPAIFWWFMLCGFPVEIGMGGICSVVAPEKYIADLVYLQCWRGFSPLQDKYTRMYRKVVGARPGPCSNFCACNFI